MDYLTQFFATQIDFRYDKKTNTYRALHLNADPTYVLYKDGRSRPTTPAEIAKQLEELG